MPTFAVRNLTQVPPPRKTSTPSLEQQRIYEGFVQEVGNGSVGELHLAADENARSVKVRLRRAAKRIGAEIQIWDADGKVYFQSATPAPKRGRPKAS